MFSHRRQLRQWAARVLLLWVFGVVSGVASGCWAAPVSQALQASVVAAGDESALAEPECELHAALSKHDAAAQDKAPAAQSHCKVFCDESGISVWTIKSPLDHSAFDLPIAPAFAAAPPVAGRSPVHLLMPRRDGGQAPPVAIAFLRLAL